MSELSPTGLAPAARRWLALLASAPLLEDFYLAGSAALTLYLAHREVAHLDLMSAVCRLAPAARRDILHQLLQLDPQLRVETARDGYLFVRAGDDTGIQLFWYPYPLLEPEQQLDALAVASLVDLGAMKLGAVISRSTEADLRDLHAICERIPLPALLDRSSEKFGHVRDFALQAAKALADLEPLEAGTTAAKDGADPPLAELTAWARASARQIARERFGVDEASSV